MASKLSLAKRRADAIETLSKAKTQIAKKLEIQFPERPFIRAVDSEHEYVYRLEELANDISIIREAVESLPYTEEKKSKSKK